MDLPTLKDFFMWCSILNGGLLLFVIFFCSATPNLVYRIQSRFFPLPRATFDTVIYAFLGAFKLLVLVFNVVPWIALSIVT